MCTCGAIHIGTNPEPVAYNWNPDCVDHGVKSSWYKSPEQTTRREEERAWTIELQMKAKEARRRVQRNS